MKEAFIDCRQKTTCFSGMMYKLIYADPPWNWQAYSPRGEGRSAKRHYPVMTLSEIAALPVGEISDRDSVLALWATDPMLDKAFEIIKAWGFEFKTVGFYWIKTNKDGSLFKGLGYYTRANPEQCLIATKGKGLPRFDRSINKAVIAPRGRHSEKPDIIREYLVRLFGDVARIELFARKTSPGWHVWGNEVQSDIDLNGILNDWAEREARSLLGV